MLKRKLPFLFFLFIVGGGFAQEPLRDDIAVLCSDEFAGRGYVDHGLKKASNYIAEAFERAGLSKIDGSYFQNFRMQVNTFPGAMEVKAGKRRLIPGTDYLVKASSGGLTGRYTLVHVGLKELRDDSLYQSLLHHYHKGHLIVLDTMSFEDEETGKRYKYIQHNGARAAGVIIKSKRRLIWTVAKEQADYLSLEIRPEALQAEDDILSVDIRAKLQKKFKTRNVWGMVKGTVYPDSFLMITAHYDHLGKMGEQTIFPGANDNASGTAMMLALARYYAQNPQPLSVVFVAFTAEEAGLIGSKYFTENPPFSLNKIRFLMNLDLEGTGQDGITAVNATEYVDDFELLVSVNESGHYLPKVAPRGKAANSDHYWFSEQGVHCFFIYQMGSYDHYHDPGDKPELLPLTAFETTQQLVIGFFTELQRIE